jgi:glutathione S-transferase
MVAATATWQFGAVVMPVLRTPQGAWVQDSSVIIDQLEATHPQRPVVPVSPVPRFAAYLLEAWCDEWWIPIAMHTRWSYPENYALFEREAGGHLLPGLPKTLQRRAVAYVADSLRGKLHAVGVRPEQFATMDRWTNTMLDQLDAHFALPASTDPPASTASTTIIASTLACCGDP